MPAYSPNFHTSGIRWLNRQGVTGPLVTVEVTAVLYSQCTIAERHDVKLSDRWAQVLISFAFAGCVAIGLYEVYEPSQLWVIWIAEINRTDVSCRLRSPFLMLCGFRSQQRTRLDAAAAAAAVAAAVTDNGSYRSRSADPSKSSLTSGFGREMAADLVARPLQAIFIWQCSIVLDPQAIVYGQSFSHGLS